MSTLVSQLVRALAWALVAAIGLQLYFAGAFVFGALTLEYHRALGGMIFLGSLLTALFSLASRPTRAEAKGFFALFGLMIVQVALLIVRAKIPAISALHAVNAVAVLMMAYRMARRANVVVASVAESPARAPRLVIG
jgi:hypothetical protein